MLIVWCVAGGFSIDALKKEAESLMIPEEKQMYYVAAQIVQLKEAEKRLELERFKMEITKTGLLWKLRTQTQRHALELFLFNCWERFQECSGAEIEQIRSKIQKFPTKPAEAKVSVASWDVLVTCCILPSVTLTRETSW